MAFLEEFSITPFAYDIPRDFAPLVVLPSLRKLVIHQGEEYIWVPHNYEGSGIAQFIQRFGDQLTDVTLYIHALTPTGLDHCLQHLTNVIRLELCSEYFPPNWACAVLTPQLFARLTPEYESHTGGHLLNVPVLPKLEGVAFRFGFGDEELLLDALVDFVAARRREGDIVRLRKAEFVVAWVHKLRRDPLKLLRAKNVNLDGFSFTGYEVDKELEM
ncbi:hypothetical protein H1R20_g2322, partial [Candolleomyces eurysporus]